MDKLHNIDSSKPMSMSDLWTRLEKLKGEQITSAEDVTSSRVSNDKDVDDDEIAKILVSIKDLENISSEDRDREYIEGLIGGGFKITEDIAEDTLNSGSGGGFDETSTNKLISKANSLLSHINVPNESEEVSEEVSSMSGHNFMLNDMGDSFGGEVDEEIALILQQAKDEKELDRLYKSTHDMGTSNATLNINFNTTDEGVDNMTHDHGVYDKDDDSDTSEQSSKSSIESEEEAD